MALREAIRVTKPGGLIDPETFAAKSEPKDLFELYLRYHFATCERSSKRHIFYKVDEKEIEDAAARMLIDFPTQLKEFYLEVGYGFLCKDDKIHTNRLMHPSDIADSLKEFIFKMDLETNYYTLM